MSVVTKHRLTESHPLAEAAFNGDGRTLTLTIIRQGFNASKSRYYTESALRSGEQAFAAAQQYLDHPTRSEDMERPEGSIRNWVAQLSEVAYDANAKALRGTAKIIDPDFLEKVRLMDEAGVLGTLGVSIRAIGAGEEVDLEGVRTFRVDEFTEGISVDYVTRPGAGGHVEFRESDSASEEEDDMSAEAIAAAERRAAEAEARAKEAEERATKAESAAAAATAAIESMKAEEAKRSAQTAIGALIGEAELPDSGKDYLRKTLANETDTDAAKAQIAAFSETVKGLIPDGVRGMGESAPADRKPADLDAKVSRLFGEVKAS